MNRFLNSNGEISHSRYLRVLAIGSLDILVTLPQGVIACVVLVHYATHGYYSGTFVWYTGWDILHRNWSPRSMSLEHFSKDTFQLVTVNYGAWTSIVLGFAIFALFGLTKAARSSYWRLTCAIMQPFGCDLASRVRERPALLPMTFGQRIRRTQASGMGCVIQRSYAD